MQNVGRYHQIFIKTSIFFFFSLLLIFPRGYNYGSSMLLVGSLLFLFYSIYKKVGFSDLVRQNKPIFMAISFYFIVALFFVLFHGERLKLIDNPFRAYLFLSVIIFIGYSKIKFDVLLYSIPLGGVIAGLVALYQYYILHLPSAFNEQMKIQSGDIAMSLGLFSFVISLYLLELKKNKLALFSIIGALFGILASILSFARGGWVGVPIILLIVLYTYKNMISKKLLIALILGTFASAIALSLNEQFVDRILDAKNNLTYYFEGVKDGSIGARLDMWKIGINAFLEHPFSGWNLQELDNYKMSLVEKGIVSQEFIVYSHLHNQFIDEVAKKGILGGLAILGVFFIPLYVFYKKKNNMKDNKRVKFITTLAIVHILSTMAYCLTQAFIIHNSGNIFYFFVLFLFYAFMVNESATTSE